MSAPIGAVLFDLDNTLYDRDRAFLGWAHWFVRERLGLVAGARSAETVDRIVAMDAGGHGSKEDVFRHLKERHPDLVEEAEALAVSFRGELLAHLGSIDEGTRRVLDALDRAGTPWGIVTNGSRNQSLKVARLGLGARPRCVLVSEIEGWRKPAPEIFRAAAGRLGVDPRSIVFVGDNPGADIVGAARAGMRTAWLRRGRAWPEHLAAFAPDHTLDSLADLLHPAGPVAGPAPEPHCAAASARLHSAASQTPDAGGRILRAGEGDLDATTDLGRVGRVGSGRAYRVARGRRTVRRAGRERAPLRRPGGLL